MQRSGFPAWRLLAQPAELQRDDDELDHEIQACVVKPSLVCKRCSASDEFSSVAALRTHYKQAHPGGGGAAGAEGDDSESSDSDEEEKDANEDEQTHGAMIPLKVTDRASGTVYAYRALLETCDSAPVAELASDRMRRGLLRVSALDVLRPGETWAVVMFQSGYFAIAVWQMAPGAGELARTAPTTEAGYPKLLMHKRFARYTTRRKQGGSQSAHDNKRGSTAKSAGANLRRAGELHLQQDIAGLLADSSWSSAIGACRRIFMSAPRTATGQLYDGRTLVRGDPRIARVPFMTGRPSLLETQRIVETLGALLPAEAVAAASSAAPSSSNAANKSQRSVDAVTAGGGDDAMPSARALASTLRSNAASSSSAALGVGVLVSTGTADLDAAIDALNFGPDSDDSSSDIERGDDNGKTLETYTNDVAAAPSKQRHRNRRRGQAPTSAAAAAAAKSTEAASIDDSYDDALLEAAVAEASQQAATSRRRALESKELSSLKAAVTASIHDLAERLRVPPFVVARMLGVPALVPYTGTSSSSSSSSSRTIAPAVTGDALTSAQDALATAGYLLDSESASPSEVCGALGWDGVAAALLVAHSGYFVDWAQVEPPSAAAALASAVGAGAGDSDDDDGLPSLTGGGSRAKKGSSAPAAAKASSKKKKGKGKAAVSQSSAADAVPPPPPPPEPVDPLAGLSPAERKRALMAQAAERRQQVQTQGVNPGLNAAASSEASATLAGGVLRAVTAVASTWVPGLR